MPLMKLPRSSSVMKTPTSNALSHQSVRISSGPSVQCLGWKSCFAGHCKPSDLLVDGILPNIAQQVQRSQDPQLAL